jgi:hypothetical protein
MYNIADFRQTLMICRWKMIVVTRSEKEETQEGKIKGEISIPTHP